MDEFDLIETCFRPLAKGFPGSLNLADDAALVSVPASRQLVIAKDAIVEGVHFLGSEDPAMIARKLLRVNLSDLAAMGATPFAYLMAVMLPKKTNATWLKTFAKGLADDQRSFGVTLIGGDTTATPGPLTLSLTALGLTTKNRAIKRSGARPGDDIYVSGSIGDSALGLLCMQGTLPANRFLRQRYLLPQPRVALGQKLYGIASACIDISDGLMQDLEHICRASKIRADIQRPLIPLSRAAAGMVKKNPALWETIVSGGDDYELLFTAPKDKAKKIAALARSLRVPLTKIGVMTKAREVKLVDEKGKRLEIKKKGFRHF